MRTDFVFIFVFVAVMIIRETPVHSNAVFMPVDHQVDLETFDWSRMKISRIISVALAIRKNFTLLGNRFFVVLHNKKN